MTSSPLSLRAFVNRFFVALLIGGVLIAAFVIGARPRSQTPRSRRSHGPTSTRACSTKGGNYLIIGSDTRAFIDSQKDAEHFGDKASQTGQRSDTIMVAHIDPGKHTGILVSFPRDLWVEIPGHGTAKINAAFAFGGPQLAIATIEQDFDIPISHYLEVDFAGFRDIVNAIGSVPIYFPTPARDTNTGLAIAAAGCQQPLGRGGARVRAVALSTSTRPPTASGTPTRPPTSVGSSASSTSSVRWRRRRSRRCSRTSLKFNDVLDKTVASLDERQELRDRPICSSSSRAFRGTDPNAFPMYTLPATNAFRDGQSVLLLDDAQAAPTLARLRGAPEEAPTAVPKHRAVDGAGHGRERLGRGGRGGDGARRSRRRRVRARRARRQCRSLRLRRDRGPVRARRQDQGAARARVPRRGREAGRARRGSERGGRDRRARPRLPRR